MDSKQIRKSFIDFFVERGHTFVPSSPVVPFDDPTLLFTNAGMNQFKDVFLGYGKRDYKRAVNTQKCIRAGGKHNDLEEVGLDGYHHTFFEMLGNWSFGDYYKLEAITWAWELLTQVWMLPKNRIWATVYTSDDEAFEIWKEHTDIDPSHILRFGEKDNFWEMGETGPCGPCSEIHFDMTENGCTASDINSGLEDVIEIWNLVFIQYNRDEKGKLHSLPNKHVDTGMGLERIVRVINNKKSNYQTDLFLPIIKKLEELTGKEYKNEAVNTFNAIADHSRALTFAIADGALPSNEGRGYVLRRILRRALRLARKIGYKEPLLHKLVPTIVDNFGEVFPELKEKNSFIIDIILSEEESFNQTLDRGIELFYEVYEKLRSLGAKIFPGEIAFKLYDTYGFPLDLTEVIAKEHNLKVDIDGFNKEMAKQRQRARAARKENIVIPDTKPLVLEEKIKNISVEYNPYTITPEGIQTQLLYANKIANSDLNVVVLKTNPFYSEAGGQISDTGQLIFSDGKTLEVIDSKDERYIYVKNYENISHFHKDVIAKVDYRRRLSIQRNHSATHLIHEALRQVLGQHVKQMGSLVSDEYLRFDFPHYTKLKDNEIAELENLVNSKITENIIVQTLEDLPIEEANKIPNVKRFFGDKYGSRVRIVIIDENFSIEFCGGTHVSETSDIGLFKIVKEESISSGIRRIFARTGEGILNYLSDRILTIENIISELPEKYSAGFKIGFEELRKAVRNIDIKDTQVLKMLLEHQNNTLKSLYDLREKYLEEKRQEERKLLKQSLQKRVDELKQKINSTEEIKKHKIFVRKIEVINMDEFRELGEKMYELIPSGIGLLATVLNGKISLICSVSNNLIRERQLNAGKIVSELAKKLDGGGGGKPHLATAGGKAIDRLDDELRSFETEIKKLLNE
ncbi:MAG: alanine--tRNA ligase [Ignavibacteria bacterium]